MKKILSVITITAVLSIAMVACNSKSGTTKAITYQDTVGFAQFQAWKAINERLDPNEAYMVNTKNKTQRASDVKSSGSMYSADTHTAKIAKKKGWSKAAKYSAIGGGAGILLGAIINKRNRVAGGIIGGILGGGIGYGIGRSKDKKEGRY